MNIRLFNDNGCETLTEAGRKWQDDIYETLRLMVKEANEAGISLRDLNTLVCDEICVLTAETRLRKGLAESKAKRTFPPLSPNHVKDCGCPGCK